jgi:hypothetical protein
MGLVLTINSSIWLLVSSANTTGTFLWNDGLGTGWLGRTTDPDKQEPADGFSQQEAPEGEPPEAEMKANPLQRHGLIGPVSRRLLSVGWFGT